MSIMTIAEKWDGSQRNLSGNQRRNGRKRPLAQLVVHQKRGRPVPDILFMDMQETDMDVFKKETLSTRKERTNSESRNHFRGNMIILTMTERMTMTVTMTAITMIDYGKVCGR